MKAALITAASLGELELAAVLAGATLKGALSDFGGLRHIVPGGDEELEDVAQRVRNTLGDAAYAVAERRGAAMDLNEAVEYALSALDAVLARAA